MGKLFLITMLMTMAFLSGTSSFQPVFAGSPILFPPAVPTIPPPTADPELGSKDLERLREQRLKRSPPKPPPPAWDQGKRNAALAHEAQIPRDYKLMMQVSLAYPLIATSGPRSAYTTEPTSHFSMFFRAPTTLSQRGAKLWWGWRMAPFAGTGIYEQTAGRYGFVYFGPMIGLGKIGQAAEAEDQGETRVAAASTRLIFLQRQAWFLMAGLAVQNRYPVTDPSSPKVDSDFDTQGVALDGTGLWAEFSFATIHFGAVGLHYVAGVQLGEGKVFSWVGLAAGAWY